MEQDDTDPTGVRETSSSLQPATIRARERKAAAAVEMFIDKHKSYKEIAKKLGYPDANAARVAVERYMEEQLKAHPRSISAMRDMAGRRLDNALRSVAKKAMDDKHPEHLAAVQQYRGIVMDWSKHYGLTAPQQVVVSSPSLEQIEQVAGELLSKGTRQLAEGDIFGDDADDSEVQELHARQQEDGVWSTTDVQEPVDA